MRTTTVRDLGIEEALAYVDEGAAFVDLRTTGAYLDAHVPGSMALLYEFGPGMASRARDCIPLHVPLIVLDLGWGDVSNAVASLRGKGFAVPGVLEDGVNRWAEKRGPPASTATFEDDEPPQGALLDVSDPGARHRDGATRIPVELLWNRAHEIAGEGRIVVAAGYGVRAALAVGMLERAGADDIALWKSLPGGREAPAATF